VTCNNEAGARELADLLIDRGHSRLVFVAGPQGTSTNREREAGFIRRLMERGCSLAGRVDTTSYSFSEGYRAAAEALSVKPDAIFFANDVLALGGMDRLRHDFGIGIPSDISVVGFDDIQMAGWPSYNLTTMRQPIAEMVRVTVELITNQDAEPARRIVPGELVSRGTVRPA
jgi:DNA-binding LacI/PurR family transcriptional regulator